MRCMVRLPVVAEQNPRQQSWDGPIRGVIELCVDHEAGVPAMYL